MGTGMLSRRSLLAGLGLGLGMACLRAHAGNAPSATMERIRQRGSLMVGLYHAMPPFHVDGQGIDVEVGKAIAAEMGLGFSALPFHEGESMDDDLRNMVWKGHYLGWGPADVLLHVPVERPLMQTNPQVQIVAPYYRERVLLAFDRQVLPQLHELAQLRAVKVAVAGQSLAGWLLIGAEEGMLRDHLSTRFPDGVAAAQALREGRVGAAAGLASELETVLANDPRFALAPLPAPRAPKEGWAVGCAVKKDAADLAGAITNAMQRLQAERRLESLFSSRGVSWHL